jgi:hypothetical protein
MGERQPLDTYLNDHLAGGTAATDLAEQLQKENAGTALGEFLAQLVEEVKQDHATLLDIMGKLGIGPNPIKQAGAKIAGLASRFKLGGGPNEIGRLLALETLSIGIEGKACLWLALQEVADQHGALASFDFGNLLQRAETQRKGVERERLTAASEALSAHATV